MTGDNNRDTCGDFLIVQTCLTYRQWYSEDAKLLQQVADQLAIAIHQASLLAGDAASVYGASQS